MTDLPKNGTPITYKAVIGILITIIMFGISAFFAMRNSSFARLESNLDATIIKASKNSEKNAAQDESIKTIKEDVRIIKDDVKEILKAVK